MIKGGTESRKWGVESVLPIKFLAIFGLVLQAEELDSGPVSKYGVTFPVSEYGAGSSPE